MNAIVNRLHRKGCRAEQATEEDWKELKQYALDCEPSFLERISSGEAKLTDKELKVSLLSRLLFTPSEQATLLGLSKQRITNIRSAANRKLFSQSGAKFFDGNILGL